MSRMSLDHTAVCLISQEITLLRQSECLSGECDMGVPKLYTAVGNAGSDLRRGHYLECVDAAQ